MNKNLVIKYALIHAIGAVAYISLAATFMSYASRIFGPGNNGIIGTVAFLLVFVISAAAMGMIIFARPIMWYLDGLKKEAVSLAIYTIGFLILIAIAVVLGFSVFKK